MQFPARSLAVFGSWRVLPVLCQFGWSITIHKFWSITIHKLLIATSATLILSPMTHAAIRFDKLGVVSRAYGEKSILVSDDGNTVLATQAGTYRHAPSIWRISEEITVETIGLPRESRGISGNGLQVVGEMGTSKYNLAGTRLANDASFDGSVIVGSESFGNSTAEAFRLDQDGNTLHLGVLPGGLHASAATAVSPDGNTIVGYSSGPQWFQPFRWTAETGMLPLGTLPGDTRQMGIAYDVSADGQAVIGMASSTNGVFEAFRWTPATGMQPLGDLPGGFFASTAYDVTGDGRVVVGVGSSSRFRMSEAFVWKAETGMLSLTDVLTSEYGLELGNFHLMEATSISANGRVIVGWGLERGVVDPEAIAWRVDFGQVPEPAAATMLLLSAGLATYCVRGSRRVHRRNS